MGRFYKTSQPENIDFMFKLPENLMMQATSQAAQDIEQNYVAMMSLQDKLQLPAFGDRDKKRGQEIVASYEDKINQMAQVLQKSPLDFRTKSGDIIGLSRSIHKDWTTGEAAAIMGNATKFSEMQKRYEAMIKGGQIKDPHSVPYLMKHIKDKFEQQGGTSYNPETGNYNDLQIEELTPYVDLPAKFQEYVKEMKPQIIAQGGYSHVGGGKYIRTTKTKTEVLSEEALLGVMWNKFMSDSNVNQYLQQREKIGVLPQSYDAKGNPVRLYNDQGNFIGRPFDVTKEKNKKGEEVDVLKWNDGNYLAGIMKGTIATNAVNNVLQNESELKADQYAYLAASQVNNTKPTTFMPDTKTQTLTVKTALENTGQYKSAQESYVNRSTGYNNYLTASPLLKNMNTTQAAAYQADLTKAKVLAEQGDINGAMDLARKHNDQDAMNMLVDMPKMYAEAQVYSSQVDAIATVLQKSMNLDLNKPEDVAKLENEVNRFLATDKSTSTRKNLNVTYGNMWADFSPQVQKAALQNLDALNDLVSDPTQWGEIYFVESGGVNADGKEIVTKTTLDQLVAAKKINIGQITAAATATPIVRGEGAGYIQEEEEEEAKMQSGKTKSHVGTAGLVTNMPTFKYNEGFGATTAKTTSEDWMIAIPILIGDGTSAKGTVYIPSSSYHSSALDGLKFAVEQQRITQHNNDLLELSIQPMAAIAKEKGYSYNEGEFVVTLNGQNFDLGKIANQR